MTFRRQHIAVALTAARLAIGSLFEDIFYDQFRQPFRKHGTRDTKIVVHRIEPLNATQRFAQD